MYVNWSRTCLISRFYDLLVFGWILDRFELQTAKGKNLAGMVRGEWPGIRLELGRIALGKNGSGQIPAGLSRGRYCSCSVPTFICRFEIFDSFERAITFWIVLACI